MTPIRHKFKVEPLTDDEYAKLDEISEKGKALFRKLKDESDEIFQNNRSRSTGGIDVYSVTESDTASEGSILCDGKHYSIGNRLKASYNNLRCYVDDGHKAGYHKGWLPSSPNRPAGYERYALYSTPTVSLMDAECYKNGVLWKGRGDIFYWLVRA